MELDSSAVPRTWEVTSDPALRAACAAAVVALVPVPVEALRWSGNSPPSTCTGGQLAALQMTKDRRWVAVTADDEGPLTSGGTVHDTRRVMLWYCRRCRSRLFVTGIPSERVGVERGARTHCEGIVRLFAGALDDGDENATSTALDGEGLTPSDVVTGMWRGSEVVWKEMPPLIGEDVGEQGRIADVAFWFPTSKDGATPGAAVVSEECARNAESSATDMRAMDTGHFDGCTFTCACGNVQAVSTASVDQLQHCHCAMCRSIHGSPFATWAPLPESAVSWNDNEGALRAASTSPNAVRYGCVVCGTTLSIKYYSQPATVWLAAGAADGLCIAPLGKGLRRVLHISCSWRSVWWPVSGEERRTGIPYAG